MMQIMTLCPLLVAMFIIIISVDWNQFVLYRFKNEKVPKPTATVLGPLVIFNVFNYQSDETHGQMPFRTLVSLLERSFVKEFYFLDVDMIDI